MTLELDDIQSGVLRNRPSPYSGAYALLRIDDFRAGREMLGRLAPAIASAANPTSPAGDAWVSVAFTFEGLKALRLPAESLDSFPPEFQQGMAARAEVLGDVGENSPGNWEKPFGSPEVHLALAAMAPDEDRLQSVLERARARFSAPGIEVIYRLNCHVNDTDREPFGFRDGIGQPDIEGSGIPCRNPKQRPLKAGGFVLGYPDETGSLPPMPQPDALGRNGTFVVFRKLHQRVAKFRRYLRANASNLDEEELLAAKMIGRWRSGAPLVLSPERDDPELGADPKRNNNFLYGADNDAAGFKCPPGSHARRMNPRDCLAVGNVSLHRMIRRGTSYGPPLPEGVLEDDGADRGIMFVFIGSNLKQQFEFVQSQWVSQGLFIDKTGETDPVVGANDGTGILTIPEQPIRRRVRGLPQFVVTRGGEYCFMPGLKALRWIADLKA
ncbi:MAG TPA: Dyp-type peroxidase [Bryobacteraceae bacterium]